MRNNAIEDNCFSTTCTKQQIVIQFLAYAICSGLTKRNT